jgi:heat shock protein HslJ
VCLAVLVAILVGCGNGGPSPGAGGGTIEGITWVLNRASIDALVEHAPGNARADLTLEKGRAGGRAACNSYSGGYTVVGDALSFEAFAVTEMACEEPLMALETAYLTALAKVTGYSVDAGVLVLTGGPGDLTFDREVKPEPLPLTGTTWHLESIAHGDAVSSTIAGTDATLTLANDGTASGNATCNTFSGSYEVSGVDLTFGSLATTEIGCTGTGETEQEQQVLGALAATRTFAIEGDRLTLSAEDGAMLLMYRGA